MNILSKENVWEQPRKNAISDTLKELFLQKKSINQDLQDFGLKCFHLENAFQKSWLENILEKTEVTDDTYRCFLDLVSFISAYELEDLKHLTSFYKKTRIENESSLVHLNNTKRKQLEFLKNNLQYLLWDMKYLKEKVRSESLIFIKNNAFNASEKSHISETQKRDMLLFLREFPARLNSYQHFQNIIYELWSKDTKAKIKEYEKMKEYL